MRQFNVARGSGTFDDLYWLSRISCRLHGFETGSGCRWETFGAATKYHAVCVCADVFERICGGAALKPGTRAIVEARPDAFRIIETIGGGEDAL